MRNILLYMLCGSAYTNREERTIYYIQTHNLTLSQCYRQHNKIVWLMLYSDSRVCYPCVIQLINKFKHTHTHNECTMILFLLKMRISHRPWLLVCLLIRSLVYLIFFPQLFIQSLLFWLTKIFFQTISNTHSQKEKKKKKKKTKRESDRNCFSINGMKWALSRKYGNETKLTNFYKLRHMLDTHKLH